MFYFLASNFFLHFYILLFLSTFCLLGVSTELPYIAPLTSSEEERNKKKKKKPSPQLIIRIVREDS